MHRLTLTQRRQLLQLTAASGSIPNLVLAASCAGLALAPCVAAAAARAGQLHVCQWLLEHGGKASFDSMLDDAAAGGHRAVCEWLTLQGARVNVSTLTAAATHGHLGLMEELVDRIRPHLTASGTALILPSICGGCDLPALQRAFTALGAVLEGSPEAAAAQGDDEEPVLVTRWIQGLMMAWAASSPTPDWRAKWEWLEGLGCRPSAAALHRVASCLDASYRMEWLAGRGLSVPWAAAVTGAARAGNTDMLLRALAGGAQVGAEAADAAAEGGHLTALQALHAHGCPIQPRALPVAARSGKLPAVAWLVEALGPEAHLTAEVFAAAAASGSVELLAWLRGRGCPWDAAAFAAAAGAGCEEALEWLAERGCPMPDDGGPYIKAKANSDMHTIRCLRRLGCPGACE